MIRACIWSRSPSIQDLQAPEAMKEWLGCRGFRKEKKKKNKRDYIPKFAQNSPNHNFFHNSGQSPACCDFHRSLSTVHMSAALSKKLPQPATPQTLLNMIPTALRSAALLSFALVSNRRRSRPVGANAFRVWGFKWAYPDAKSMARFALPHPARNPFS